MNAVLFHYGLTPIQFTVYSYLKFCFGSRDTCMINIRTVAAVLGVNRAGAYELAHSEEFPVLKVGSRIVIPKDKFLLWIVKQCGREA